MALRWSGLASVLVAVAPFQVIGQPAGSHAKQVRATWEFRKIELTASGVISILLPRMSGAIGQFAVGVRATPNAVPSFVVGDATFEQLSRRSRMLVAVDNLKPEFLRLTSSQIMVLG